MALVIRSRLGRFSWSLTCHAPAPSLELAFQGGGRGHRGQGPDGRALRLGRPHRRRGKGVSRAAHPGAGRRRGSANPGCGTNSGNAGEYKAKPVARECMSAASAGRRARGAPGGHLIPEQTFQAHQGTAPCLRKVWNGPKTHKPGRPRSGGIPHRSKAFFKHERALLKNGSNYFFKTGFQNIGLILYCLSKISNSYPDRFSTINAFKTRQREAHVSLSGRPNKSPVAVHGPHLPGGRARDGLGPAGPCSRACLPPRRACAT